MEAISSIHKSSSIQKRTRKRKRSSHFEVKEEQQRRNKILILEKLKPINDYLKEFGLEFSNVVLKKAEPDMSNSGKYNLKIANPTQPQNNELIYKSISWKDKNNISDRTYISCRRELAPQIPKIDDIRTLRKSFDQKLCVNFNTLGVFYTVREKVMLICRDLIPKVGLSQSEPLKLKFSTDGTNIGPKLKIVNFVFTCINSSDECKASIGNFILGIFRVRNENYLDLNVCLKELFDEIKLFNEIEIKEKTYSIRKYFTADWKCLALVLGLNSASSNFPCIWCKCAQSQFNETNIEWSISDPNKGARSIREANEKHGQKTDHFGYVNKPLLDSIEISEIILDLLHLFLRITDTLINLLQADINLLDGGGTNNGLDLEARPNFKTYVDYVESDCKIGKAYYTNFGEKKLCLRDLSGGEKDKLFKSIRVASLFPKLPNCDKIEEIWKQFYEIYTSIRHNLLDSIEIKEKTRDWLKLFLGVYTKKNITPYMHAFVAHMHEFVKLHGNVNLFNLQGLEKLNDLTTIHYFRSTNKHNKNHSALEQLLKKKNRLELLRQDINENF